MSEYFPEEKSLGGRVKVKLDLSNYPTITAFKTATGMDTSKLAKKVDLANLKFNLDKLNIDILNIVPLKLSNLKSKLDKLDVDKLVPVPVDLSKLNDLVKNDVIKKDVYNAKIKNIEDKIPDITHLATKTTLDVKINEVNGEICNITNLATNLSLKAKMNEFKGEIPNIINLATTSAVTAVEYKIPNVSKSKKLTITQKLMKLKRKLLAVIMINIVLLQNLIRLQEKFLI